MDKLLAEKNVPGVAREAELRHPCLEKPRSLGRMGRMALQAHPRGNRGMFVFLSKTLILVAAETELGDGPLKQSGILSAVHLMA
jgi:hypothetical protein